MKKAIARILEWGLGLLQPALVHHGTVDAAPSAPAPTAPVPAPTRLPVSFCYADPPTLSLPRIPVGERFPVAWDTDPVPLYIVRYEAQRALGAAW